MRYIKSVPGLSVALLCSVFVLQGCISTTKSRYAQKVDSAPTFSYGEIEYVEPTPVREEYNVWNSKPYQVNGRYYTPLSSGRGFVQQGYASWYGQKFHGYETANGEVFDMFELTAAHTTLPLPSFARVTNLENGRTTTVRINDRGPFHDDRILDLSYAAAKKLGFKEKGTSKVKIEVLYVEEDGLVRVGTKSPRPLESLTSKIEVKAAPRLLLDRPEQMAAQPSEEEDKLFVQVMALTDTRRAKNLAKGLSDLLQLPTQLPKADDLYRLQIGPLENEQKAQKVIKDLANIGFDSAFRISLSPE